MVILRTLSKHATRVRFRIVTYTFITVTSPVLRLEPNDPDALQTKLTLLLHTDQHALALALSETLIDGEQEITYPLLFGRAYALYRLNREPDAHHVVGQIKPMGEYEERGVLHMKAQIVNHIFFQLHRRLTRLCSPQGVSSWQLPAGSTSLL